MIIEKKGFNDFIIYALINGFLVHKRFIYYTKKEAIKEFNKEKRSFKK